MFSELALFGALHLFHDLRGKGLTSSMHTPEKRIKCIMEWMMDDDSCDTIYTLSQESRIV